MWKSIFKKIMKHFMYFAGFLPKIVYFDFMKYYNVSELQAQD